MPDVWTEKSIDDLLKTLRRIATALEGDPKNPPLPRIAKAIESVVAGKKG